MPGQRRKVSGFTRFAAAFTTGAFLLTQVVGPRPALALPTDRSWKSQPRSKDTSPQVARSGNLGVGGGAITRGLNDLSPDRSRLSAEFDSFFRNVELPPAVSGLPLSHVAVREFHVASPRAPVVVHV